MPMGPEPAGAPIVSDQVVERAVKMRKTSPAAQAFWLLLAAGMLVAGGWLVIYYLPRLNPPPREVERLPPADDALMKLGERQTALGYSLRLPPGFQWADPPPTDQLPDGTRSYSWTVAEGVVDQRSFLHLIVIPQKTDIYKELDELLRTDDRLSFPARIVNKSAHRRIGDDDLVAVRGLLEGTADERPGVIYFVADGRRTLILIGAGGGRERDKVQYLLDHAVRTLRREP
ncbi:MAG: hypothetical protein GTO03_17995 [Planctomycetales bacterium]|nr:hypothetical protein [Planctomycetales bacterium]